MADYKARFQVQHLFFVSWREHRLGCESSQLCIYNHPITNTAFFLFFFTYIRSMFNEAIYWLSIYSGALCCVTVLFLLVGTVLILELYKVHVFMDVCCTCFPHFIFLCLMRMWYLYQNIYLQDKSNQCSEKESINFMKIYFFLYSFIWILLLWSHLRPFCLPTGPNLLLFVNLKRFQSYTLQLAETEFDLLLSTIVLPCAIRVW